MFYYIKKDGLAVALYPSSFFMAKVYP